MIHPICNNSTFYNFYFFLKIMTIHLKSTRTYFQNMKFIEWFLSEIQVKHWCIIGWEYITAQYDLAVAHPKVIHSAWKFIGRIIQYKVDDIQFPLTSREVTFLWHLPPNMETIARRSNGAFIALSLENITQVMDLVYVDIYPQYILAKFYIQRANIGWALAFTKSRASDH